MSHAWMPLYIGDYLRDTMHLTTLEHGMYLLLILHYWEHGELPHSTAGKSRVARVPWSTFRDHELTLGAFFEQPGWRHKRIERELAKLEIVSTKRKINGAKGGFHTSVTRAKQSKQLLTSAVSRPKNVTSNRLDNHKERKKEAAEKEAAPRKRVDQLTKAELAALYASKNGKG